MNCDTLREVLAAFAGFLDSGRWLRLVLFLVALGLLRIAVKVQRGANPVDFRELMLENGRTSGARIYQLGCFIASTWAFVVLAAAGTLQEWYFIGYIALWSGTAIGEAFLRMRYSREPLPAPTKVEATVAPGASVTVAAEPAPPPAPIPPAPPPNASNLP